MIYQLRKRMEGGRGNRRQCVNDVGVRGIRRGEGIDKVEER